VILLQIFPESVHKFLFDLFINQELESVVKLQVMKQLVEPNCNETVVKILLVEELFDKTAREKISDEMANECHSSKN